MRNANLISASLLSAALCAGVAEQSLAQGGWRQWEVRLHDGRRLEANPLGAPDDAHLSLSVGGYDKRDGRIARSLVDVVAALPIPDSLPAVPVGSCEDAIVRRDGTTTLGRITLTHVRWSEGVVVQHGESIDLRHVAYLVFAARDSASGACAAQESSWHQPDLTYPTGSRQAPTLCNGYCRT